ncbi:MAG: quaternary amine ABC transporter ATP-binding protein [Geminicoccaceae bacterium]
MASPAKLSCRHLWKVFGPRPKDFLTSHGHEPSLEDFAKNGPHIRACADISFKVAAGEILIVMGLSGSGKSTLIRCLARLIEPTSGEVWFDGKDLLKTTEAELIDLRRHKMGMVFQHFGLLPHRTVLENVAFPLEVQGAKREIRHQRALEMIKTVGLEGREDYYPRELSGGQQQRVGIARSLAVEPEIWFLDEPFSALDPLIRREMQDEFLRLQRMLHKTIVFITHDFDEAVRLADRIAIMKDGVVVQLGTAEELVINPADDYVAQFTKEAPRGKLITARSIMGPVNGQSATLPGVAADARLNDIAAEVLGRQASTPVIDKSEQVIGMLTRERLIETLFDRPS